MAPDSIIGFGSRALACVALAFAWQGAAAQDSTVNQQVLDRVVVFNSATALDMKFNEPVDERARDFVNFDLEAATGLGSCALNSTRGLYCLDGQEVRRWKDPEQGGDGQREFSCANPKLRLDANRADTCSALTVAQTGDVWIAGRRNKAYNLIRLTEKDAQGCREDGVSLDPELDPETNTYVDSRYCFREYAVGRPLLTKLVMIEGDEARRFDPGTGIEAPGVLGLDVRNGATYFGPVPGQKPIDIAVGAGAWGLLSKENLLDLALLQVPGAAGIGTDNYLLVTTSTGRVLALQTDLGGAKFSKDVFSVPGERRAGSTPCPTTGSGRLYAVATSPKTGRVYVTDRNTCEVAALQPVGTPLRGLQNVEEVVAVVNNSPVQDDLTLSTTDSSGSYPPEGATVTPGAVIPLARCQGTCTLIETQAADLITLSAVRINVPDSKMVLYQIRNIPDCRYLRNDPVCANYQAAIITPPGALPRPELQYLDVARMFPPEVTTQFAATNALPPALPPLLISPQYRAQANNNYRFEAILGITEPGVVFRDVFDAVFKVDQLVNSTFTCTPGNPPPETPVSALLAWDVVTWVSDRYVAPGGPQGLDSKLTSYVDTIVNSGCGSTQTRIISKSLLAYGLEMAADGRDDVFARLVDKLMDDLLIAQTQLTCQRGVDSATSDPLLAGSSSSVCPTLNASLLNADDKLAKCVGATRQPKTSAVDQNCQAFEIQFSAYRAELAGILAATPELDPANRIGGLKARSQTLWYVYQNRFLPSVPKGGFTSQ